MSTVDDAFLAVQSLGTEEKLLLISRIWNSIPRSSFRPSDRDLEEIKRRWAEYEAGRMDARPWEEVRDSVRPCFRPSESDMAEIQRRSAEIDAGQVQLIPWEEVRDSVRRRLESHD